MSDHNLVDGLVAAVAVQPDNVELRLHLVSVLLGLGRAVEALAQCRAGLERRPGDAGLLASAIASCEAVGDSELAERFRMFLRAGAAAAESLDASRGDASAPIIEPPTRWITLADVAGLADVKRQLERSFLAPMRHPELRAAFAKSLRGGMLLWGPPGCGKTHLARALAGELEIEFLAVGLDDVLSRWLGESERNLAGVFAEARRRSPCVLFFDEIDALGRRRSSLSSDGMRTTVNQLLDELDGVGAAGNEGVFVIGATNAPWDIDGALRRPGRLDRTVFVPPPDRDARRAILGSELVDRPVVPGLDLDRIAARSEGLSGADVAYVVAGAVDLALGESIDAGRVVPITTTHLERALAEVPSSVKGWLATAQTAAQYSEDEAMFAPFHTWMRGRR